MRSVFGRFDVDAVVLDLDGTLIDTLGDFVLALNAMLADLPPPYRQHRLERDRIATLLGTAPRRTLMIGDSSNDAQAARAAGCPVPTPLSIHCKAWFGPTQLESVVCLPCNFNDLPYNFQIVRNLYG